jgi:CHAT domain-containing protein
LDFLGNSDNLMPIALMARRRNIVLSLSRNPRFRPTVFIALLQFALAPLQLGAISSPGVPQDKTWVAVGRDLLEKGEYEQAISYFNKRLALAGIADRDKLEIYRNLAVLYWHADRNQEATKSCRIAHELASALGFREEASSIEAELAFQESWVRAIELKTKGDLSGSNLNFEEAWRKSRLIGSQAYEPRVLRTWSSNYLRWPETWKKYRDLNIQALNLALLLNHKVEACRAENNIGTYYHMNNHLSYALTYYLRALYYVRDLPSKDNMIICLNNIACVYISLGDYTKALDYLFEAVKSVGPEDSGPIRPSMLINLGQTFLSLARTFQTPEYYGRAMEWFTSYLSLEKKVGGKNMGLHALVGISGIYVDQGRLDEARAILIPALEKLKTDKTSALSGMILLNLAALALKSDRLPEAEKYFQEARAAAKQDENFLQMMRATYGLGRCSERRGDYGQAVASYNEAIRIINDDGSRIVDDTDRAEFISRSREPYQALIELYYKLSKKSHLGAFEREIYRISESSRARSFMEYLERQARRRESGRQGSFGPKEDSLNNERLSLLTKLSQGARNQAPDEELQSRIKHIDDMLDAGLFDEHLQNDQPAVIFRPVSLNILQSSGLTDRTALIEYFLGDEHSFLICVTKNAFHLVELPSAQSIHDSLIAYLSFLEDPSIPASKGIAAARRLYTDFLSPAENFIPGSVDHLIIVPDGILFRLPFETLVFQTAGAPAVRYLNDRYTISYSPSASAFFYLAKRPKPSYKKELLALGIADYARPGTRSKSDEAQSASSVLDELYGRSGFVMAPIPHAQREIKGLAKRVLPEKIDVYYGEKATEATFKRLDLGAYRLIHLACHAFSDDNYPLRSSLVFSVGKDDEEDGFLQVSEMYGMRTNADVVVLSACQTGRGKIVRNEGILGLPRVFFYMGARSVIATLWPINDKAGALFMDFFYDAYFQGAGKAQALQTARRKMADTKYGHPYYWASYTLTGEF